jgi:hypothetical protein
MANEEREGSGRHDEKPEKTGTGRRRFLQAGAVAGALAYVKPLIAATQTSSTISVPGPIPLPFNVSGPIPGQPFDGTVGTSQYSFSGTTNLSIDASGNATIQSSVLSGTYVSGVNHGPVTISQVGASSGRYSGTTFFIQPTPGNASYQDNAGSASATASASGIINTDVNVVSVLVNPVAPQETKATDVHVEKKKS